MSNIFKFVLPALFAAACAGAEFESIEDEFEYGQVSEPLRYQCAPNLNHFYGVNVNNGWFSEKCNVTSSTHACAYPGALGRDTPATFCNDFRPFPLVANSGWSTAERTDLASKVAPATTYIDGQLGGQCTGGCEGDPPSHFSFTAGPPTQPQFVYVLMNKVALGEVVGTANFEEFWRFAHVSCIQSDTLAEPYQASAFRCLHWKVELDWDKLKTWAQGGGQGSAGINRAAQNLFQKLYMIGEGVGTTSSFDKVDGIYIRRDIVQSGWSGDQKNWVCNAAHSENSEQLTCI